MYLLSDLTSTATGYPHPGSYYPATTAPASMDHPIPEDSHPAQDLRDLAANHHWPASIDMSAACDYWWLRQQQLLAAMLEDDPDPVLSAMAKSLVDGEHSRLFAALTPSAAQILGQTSSGDTPLWLGLLVELKHIASNCREDMALARPSRRGQASAWMSRGISNAMYSSHYLGQLAGECLHRAGLPAKAQVRCQRLITRLGRSLSAGQILESRCCLASQFPSWDQYVELARGRSGALVALALCFSNPAASAAQQREMIEIGQQLGVIYQLRRDLALYRLSRNGDTPLDIARSSWIACECYRQSPPGHAEHFQQLWFTTLAPNQEFEHHQEVMMAIERSGAEARVAARSELLEEKLMRNAAQATPQLLKLLGAVILHLNRAH